MRIAGLRMTDPWAHRVLRSRGVETAEVNGRPADLRVMVESVELEHHNEERNYRPVLHLSGELRAVVPQEPLPHGINEVTYAPGRGEHIDAFYEFDDEQLLELVGKGYFSPGFEVPFEIRGIEWELPTTIDAVVLEPVEGEDFPVVFVKVHNATELELTLETSGYDLAAYFAEPKSLGPVPTAGAEVAATAGHEEEFTPLFSDDDLAIDPSDAVSGPGTSTSTDGAVETPVMAELAREMAAVAERIEGETQRDVGDEQAVEDETERLYASRVAPALEEELALAPDMSQFVEAGAQEEQVLSDETEPEPAGFTPMVFDNAAPDLAPEPITSAAQADRADPDDRAVQRRAAAARLADVVPAEHEEAETPEF